MKIIPKTRPHPERNDGVSTRGRATPVPDSSHTFERQRSMPTMSVLDLRRRRATRTDTFVPAIREPGKQPSGVRIGVFVEGDAVSIAALLRKLLVSLFRW